MEFGSFYAVDIKNKAFRMLHHVEMCTHFGRTCCCLLPIPAAAQSKAQVCGRSPAVNVGSNPTVGMDI